MPALELIAGQAIAPGTTFTALTPHTGNVFTVKNTAPEADIRILQAWAYVDTAGTLRIRSAKMHDNVQGIRLDTLGSDPTPLLPDIAWQRVWPQDALTVELTGSAVAGNIEQAALLLYYSSLPGQEARLISPETLKTRAVNVFTVENTITPGTAGGWSGEEAINAEFDLMKANVDYALIGFEVDTLCLAVRYRGPDFANLGIGGPGNPNKRELTKEWFVHLSKVYGAPLIPIINAANKGATLIDVSQDQAGAAVTVTTIMAELR